MIQGDRDMDSHTENIIRELKDALEVEKAGRAVAQTAHTRAYQQYIEARNRSFALLNTTRALIAHVQVLILAHRYPEQYNVEDAIEAADAAWREANETQKRIWEEILLVPEEP
jgi:hypothetical protein